jgi:hypothetical protein
MQHSKPVKILDVSNMEIVFRGKQWNLEEDPTARNVTHVLERNEGIVTWLQPKVDPPFSWPALGHYMGPDIFSKIFFGRLSKKGR